MYVLVSKMEMKEKIKDWLKEAEKHGFTTEGLYVFEDTKLGFEFRYDGDIYELIEYYYSDGLNQFGLGEKFANICEGTGWWFDFDRPGIIHFTLV
jgi:hypothetical protein